VIATLPAGTPLACNRLVESAHLAIGREELNDIEIEASLWYWNKHEKG
jgi:hypothetical protein